MGDVEELDNFIKAHKKLLEWWLNGYLASYINDLTKIVAAHPKKPAEWITSWQQAAARCGCLVNHLPDFLLILAQPTQIPMAKETAKWMEKTTVSKKATKKLRKDHEPFQEENGEHGKSDSEEQEEDVEDDVSVDGDSKYTIYPR